MSCLRQLGNEQVNEVLHAAVGRTIPLTVLMYENNRWCNFRSRFVVLRDERLLIEMPCDENGVPRRFEPADKVGLNFKYKHHKYTCSATVAEMSTATSGDDEEITVVSICLPSRMYCLQRRAFTRADVPANRIVRASFWMGGKDNEPTNASPDNPVHSGSVINISAGGFRMRSGHDATRGMDIGSPAGVRVTFGAGGTAVFADAQLRHVEMCEGGAIVGFQFIGLNQTNKGREALEVIVARVSEFQRAAELTRAG